MPDRNIEIFNLNIHSIDLKSTVDKMQKAFEKGVTFENVIYDKDFKLKLVMLDYENRSGRIEKENDTVIFITTLSEVKDIITKAENTSTVIKEYTDADGSTVLKILS